jgi:TP901 family phage tail tape measure protein
LSGSAVTERADAVIKLAQVTGMSAEAVSNQMTAIWNNFDDGTKSLEYYADALAKLGAATAASTAEISDGLEKFAAIADTVGLSYETATAAVATVIDKTKQSADVVGTAFKTMFARMEGLSLGETLEDGVDLNKYSEAL